MNLPINLSVKLDDRIDPEGFHAIGRAPRHAEVTIRVAYEGFPRDVALEFGLGEPDAVQSMLTTDRAGEFRLPRTAAQGELVSVKWTKLPHAKTVTITAHFDPAP
jgi:hypothetical protein